MKNMVPCKRCSTDFHYIPGAAGNARQLCDLCRMADNEWEVERLKEEMVTEKNRYLIGTFGRKNEYDPINILIDGEMPEFVSDADRFVCAMEMGMFIKRQKGGFCGMEKCIAELLEHLGPTHAVILIKQWSLPLMERATKHPDLGPIMSDIVEKIT